MKKHKSKQTLSATLILLAQGKGKRYSNTNLFFTEKQFSLLDGLPVYLYSLFTFYQSEHIQNIVVVSAKKYHNVLKKQIQHHLENNTKPIFFTSGGKERYLSVYEGIKACPIATDYVFIHDAARPLIHADTINELATFLIKMRVKNPHAAVIPVTEMSDSIKAINTQGVITTHLKRKNMCSATTPQCFPFNSFKQAYQIFLKQQNTHIPTDDAEVYNILNNPIYTLKLLHPNPKLTYANDKAMIMQFLTKK